MNLTSEQSTVVNLAAGRHLVLAPPGSGKTEMLSQRIIRALGSQVPPDKMLCATFTNRAAFEMRDRVSAAADDMTLPDVGNLHHFCHRFLISVRKLQPGKHVLDEVQQREFVREVCDVLREELRSGQSADLKRTHGVTVMGGIRGICEPMRERIHGLLEGAFSDYARRDKDIYSDILSAVLISHQRRLGIPPCYLRPLPPEMFALTGANAIAAIERAYSGLKRKFLSVDFDDLINETYLHVVSHPIPDENRYRWIQIDEVQDLNPLQWRIVRELTAPDAVSVYFGDVEQSIFSFLGASAGNFAGEVAACERHYFRTNFRATPLLLEILMRYSLLELRSDWDFLPAPADVTRANGELTLSAETSGAAVVGRVRQLLDSGVAENAAILVRNNADADRFEELVRPLGYRHAKVSGLDLFSYAPMRDFMAFISLFTEKPPMTAWSALFRRFGGIATRAIARYFVRGMFASGWDARRIFDEKNPIPLLPLGHTHRLQWAWGHRRALSALRGELKSAHAAIAARLKTRVGFREVFRAFADVAFTDESRYSLRELMPEHTGESGAEPTFEKGRDHAFERIETFLRYAEHVYKDDARPFVQILAEDWDRLSRLKEADLLVGDERIVISTIHKAKGRQFDAVILPDADGIVSEVGGSDLDEAYRLLYVAMSRAKRHLSIFGCTEGGPCAGVSRCFDPGYTGYYLRKSRGEDLGDDWLSEWERLAEHNLRRECPKEPVEAALGSSIEPVVRMALKTLRYAADADWARRIYLEHLSRGAADAAMSCLADLKWFDAEVLAAVRDAAIRSPEDFVHRAALAYCRAGLASGESHDLFLDAAGDFIYSRRGELRLDAATILYENGVRKWQDVITGAKSDFARLADADDPSHEPTLAAILATKLPEKYDRAIREIVFHRASRNR